MRPDATGNSPANWPVALVRGPIVASAGSINNEAVPCIGLAYIAAFTQANGYPCTLVDAVAGGLGRWWALPGVPGFICQGMTFDETCAAIPAGVRVIGVSAMFSGEWPATRALIQTLRRAFPDATIIVGGEHITALTEFSLRNCPEIDYAVMGEGEQTLVALVDALREGRCPDAVPGVAFLEGKTVYRTGEGAPPRIRDIDKLPWPAWPEGYLEAFWAAGKSYGVHTGRDMPMMLSRGCPFACTFCSNPGMWTRRYILRSIDDIIAELRHHIQRYDITGVQLYDLTAITKKSWAIDLCRRLLDEGIQLKWSFPSGTRSEALDRDMLDFLRKIGCNYLVYAPESGSPATLKTIRKQVDLAALTRSVVEAHRQGLKMRTNLIIGFPGETRRQMFETISFGLGLAMKGADEVSINIFSPYPGTEIFDNLLDAGRINLGDEYFLALTSLNSDYSVFSPMTVNEAVSARELAVYRLVFMLANYAISYLRQPSRIWRTLGAVFGNRMPETVLEHRLQDLRHRLGAKGKGTSQ
jgi:radical SAM superfamily enzyme YgiQ (UPF0313 family)